MIARSFGGRQALKHLILDSLKYTRLTFEDYQKYPSYEFKLKKIEEVNKVMEVIREIKAAL